VGDFGIGFNGPYWHDKVNAFHEKNNYLHRFIRGNHDNPQMCKSDMPGWIPDGHVEDDIMFMGGAWSIDQDYRTPGVNWWRDEELSYLELNLMVQTYLTVKPRVMVTHDCPTLTAYHLFIRSGVSTYGGKNLMLTRTGEALQQMFEAHQPDHWFFGHWHHTVNQTIDGTQFHCLGICDYMDFDEL
jgi:hypothetical protein